MPCASRHFWQISGRSLDELSVDKLPTDEAAKKIKAVYEPYGQCMHNLELIGSTVANLPSDFFKKFQRLRFLCVKDMPLLEEIPASVTSLIYLR